MNLPSKLTIALMLAVSGGCVHRTIVRDRSSAQDTSPRSVTIGDGTKQPEKPAQQPVVVVQPTSPPPAAPVETRPPPPPGDYVWIDGKYEWKNSRWEWNPGHWEQRT